MKNIRKKPGKIEEIVSLMFTISRAMKSNQKIGFKQGTASFLQTETLNFIAQKNAATMKELANYLSVTPPSATALAQELIKMKFLTRTRSKGDKREVRLGITPLGEKILGKSCEMRYVRLKTVLSALTGEEMSELAKILKKISAFNKKLANKSVLQNGTIKE